MEIYLLLFHIALASALVILLEKTLTLQTLMTKTISDILLYDGKSFVTSLKERNTEKK